MAFSTETSTVKTLKPAEGWLNVYISVNGKDHKVGAIPLDNSKALHARINTACASKGVEAIEGFVTLNWQAGGTADPAQLDLPF